MSFTILQSCLVALIGEEHPGMYNSSVLLFDHVTLVMVYSDKECDVVCVETASVDLKGEGQG